MEEFKIEIERNKAGDMVMRCDNPKMTGQQIIMIMHSMIVQLTEQIIVEKVTARLSIIRPGSLEDFKLTPGKRLQ